jgi:bacterioferritin-associated ferredoxin
MYIRNCNGIRARQIEAAIQSGATSPRAVLRACGAEPCCGRCLLEIGEKLRDTPRVDNWPGLRA